MRQEPIKILEENTGSNLFDIGYSNFLQDTSLKARETKAKMNYWDFTKIKIFCTAKETDNKTKRQPTEWDKIFANHISNKRLISKIYKEHIQLNTNKPKPKQKQKPTQFKNGQQTDISPKTYRWLTDT